MPYGLIASLILHAALLGWALLTIAQTPPPAVMAAPSVEISLDSVEDEITRQKKGEREARAMEADGKQGDAKEPPKKEPVKPTPPPPPVAAAPPPPEPPKPEPEPVKLASVAQPAAPSADELKKIEEKIAEDGEIAAQEEAKKKAEKAAADAKAKADADAKQKLADEKKKKDLEKKARDQKIADDKRKREEAQKLAFAKIESDLKKLPDQAAPPKALLDKTQPKPASAAGNPSNAQNSAKGPSKGTDRGSDNAMTASKMAELTGILSRKLYDCWSINAGMEGASKIAVKAIIKLTPEGQLIGDPVVSGGSGPLFDDAANAVKRALVKCQPYSYLPAELYNVDGDGWHYMAIPFDPGKMFR